MPSVAVPAATVILLRDGPISPVVLMLERHTKSTLLPDMYVFPGGRVEDQDQELTHRLSRFSTGKFTDIDAEDVKGFLVAAIRETFEESGILLARRRGDAELLGKDAVTPLLPHRTGVQGGHPSFREVVESADLELAADELGLHAHWITPEVAPRRFDTLFFTVGAPSEQLVQHDGIETSSHIWIRPEDALEQRSRGERQIIFPTARNLEILTGFKSAQLALDASRRRPVMTVMPVIEERDGDPRLVIPREAGYPTTEESISGLPQHLFRKSAVPSRQESSED
jgi:8-oxo-dGTP pyrophosphatase MutT (NUDIX family)